MIIYKNRYSDIELTEEEYDALLQREAEELWENLDDEDKLEYDSKEQYIERVKYESDYDFVMIDTEK